MPRSAKIPDFSFTDLLTSMQQALDHAEGEITVRTLHLKSHPAALSGKDIADIRASLNVRPLRTS